MEDNVLLETEIIIVNVYLDIMEHSAKLVWFSSFTFFFYIEKKKKKKKKKLINNNSIAVDCLYIGNEGNAEWPQTLANRSTVNGHCIIGYYGSISRTCTQDGSNTIWGPISGSCHGILSYLFIFHLFIIYLFVCLFI